MEPQGKTAPAGTGDDDDQGVMSKDAPGKPRDWTREEMEGAQPMPIPEIPDDDDKKSNKKEERKKKKKNGK